MVVWWLEDRKRVTYGLGGVHAVLLQYWLLLILTFFLVSYFAVVNAAIALPLANRDIIQSCKTKPFLNHYRTLPIDPNISKCLPPCKMYWFQFLSCTLPLCTRLWSNLLLIIFWGYCSTPHPLPRYLSLDKSLENFTVRCNERVVLLFFIPLSS